MNIFTNNFDISQFFLSFYSLLSQKRKKNVLRLMQTKCIFTTFDLYQNFSNLSYLLSNSSIICVGVFFHNQYKSTNMLANTCWHLKILLIINMFQFVQSFSFYSLSGHFTFINIFYSCFITKFWVKNAKNIILAKYQRIKFWRLVIIIKYNII